jgi:hypothetical protein
MGKKKRKRKKEVSLLKTKDLRSPARLRAGVRPILLRLAFVITETLVITGSFTAIVFAMTITIKGLRTLEMANL